MAKLPEEKRPQFLSAEEMEMMYRPQDERTVDRGWVQFLNRYYFHADLAVYSGKKVYISYDWDDPKDVIVYDLDGKYICKALLNGNTVPAFDVKSVAQQMEETRVRNQIKRLENKALRVREDLGGGIIEHMPDFGKMVIPDAANEPEPLPVKKTGTDDGEAAELLALGFRY